MSKIYRVLGRKGRTTIPYELRVKYGYGCNDILSFEDQEDGSVVVRKEKICNHCNMTHTDDLKEESLLELLNSLTVSGRPPHTGISAEGSLLWRANDEQIGLYALCHRCQTL